MLVTLTRQCLRNSRVMATTTTLMAALATSKETTLKSYARVQHVGPAHTHTDNITWTHTKATPVCLAKNTNPMYSPEIHGWDFSWLELLVARLPPFFQLLQ